MQSTPKRVLFLCNNTSTIQAVRVTEIIVRGANRDKNSLLRETIGRASVTVNGEGLAIRS